MTGRKAMRGQPLLLFGAVLAGWLALRVALWESPFAPRAEASGPAPLLATASAASAPSAREQSSVREQGAGVAPVEPAPGKVGFGIVPERSGAAAAVVFTPQPVLLPAWPVQPAMEANPPAALPEIVASDHSLIERRSPSHVPAARRALQRAPDARWSADGWLLLRRDGGRGGPALIDRPSYGRSQAGATVRYALAPGDPAQLRAHVRVVSALAGSRERELAGGLSLRPLPRMPLRAVAEARLGETGAGKHFRPAAYAVSELPPSALPLGLRGEIYLQGGYVGGDFATAYVDGQARAERLLARVGKMELSTGAGAWGGAQEASSRMDVGPTAAVTFQLGDVRSRLSADYRFRIAGTAEPASGPTLTLSAGF